MLVDETTILADCRDKIEVLHSLNNDVYAQVVADLLETNDRRELALALLICFEEKITSLLSQSLSLSQLNIVYTSLTRQLFQVAKHRQRALVYFYREISAAEFAYSPLGLRLNDPSWLTGLGSKELLQLALAIDDNLLSVFLSCLAPLRVSKIINSSYQDKARFVDALQAISLVNETDLDCLIAFLDRDHDQLINQWNNQHLGKVISNIDNGNGEQVIDNLVSGSRDRSSGPLFTTISKLAAKQIVEIFIDCPEQQIAQTLFSCDSLTRQAILEALPETVRLDVNDRLTNLLADDEHRITNLKISGQLQQAVFAYLTEG